jgi:hypothetical protein
MGRGGAQSTLSLNSPGAVVAAIPCLFGFHPDASLVVLGLDRPRGTRASRLGHGLRIDLADLRDYAAEFTRDLASRLRDLACGEAMIVVYPASGAAPRMERYRRLVALVRTIMRAHGIRVLDALYVGTGRFWSYTCHDPTCCPPEGVPVPEHPPELGALSVFTGIVVQADRDAIAATLDMYDGAVADEARAALQSASRDPGRSSAPFLRDLADQVLIGCREGAAPLTAGDAAALLVGLREHDLRDYMACWAADDRVDQLLVIATELARRAVIPEFATAPYTLAAWAAWALGRGTVVRLALERALAIDPAYSFALLIREGLRRGVPPDLVRDTARSTAVRIS